MRVVVLHDDVPADAPPDQLDTLVQAEAVLGALRRLGHAAVALPFTGEVGPLRAAAPEVVFNLVESPGGDGRLAQLSPAWLVLLGLPFTGSGPAGIAVSADKRLTKQVLAAAGVPVPADWPSPAGRYIIKSRFEEASVGLADDCVVEAAAVPEAMRRLAPRLGGQVVAEAFIDGRELNLSMLRTAAGWRCFPLAEIEFIGFSADKPRIVGYAAKWDEGSVEYRNTPRTFAIEGVDEAAVWATGVRAAEALGLAGHVRVDLRLSSEGEAVVMEVNANPCLSPDAGFIAAAGEAGWTLDQVVTELLVGALAGGAR